MPNEDPNYEARQSVMQLYRDAQDMQLRLTDLRKVTEDNQLHLAQAQQYTTYTMTELSHWLHELDKGPLMIEVPAEVVERQLTEPETRKGRKAKGS